MTDPCDRWPPDAAPGELPPAELARLDAHLEACAACAERAAVDALAAVSIGRAADGPPPPAPLRAALVAAAAGEKPAAPAPAAPVAHDPRIRLLCTFCKDRLDDAPVYCADCLAPVHRACFEDHGRCPAPGCGSPRWLEPGRPSRSRPGRVAATLLAVGLGLGVAALYAAEIAPAIYSHDLPPEPASASLVVTGSLVLPADAAPPVTGTTTVAPDAPPPPPGDRLRVLLVESQPRWEYRYLKNALLRDRHIAVQTVLLTSDPGFVQEHTDGLSPLAALPAPARLRDYDVIVLGDVARLEDRLYPGAFVALGAAVDAGAGLVVIDGEGSGAAWQRTALGPLLPVRFDEGPGVAGQFQVARTAAGEAHPALQLDADAAEDRRLWTSLPDLHWHAAARESTSDAQVLAHHPETARPLVATRRQGQGTVVWLGVDETWRWRAGVGDRFTSRVHGQLIRLASLGRREARPLPRVWLTDGKEVAGDLTLFRRGAGQFVETARGNVPLRDVARIVVASSDPCPVGVGVVLQDGSVVWGELVRGDGEQVVVRAVLLGEVRLAIDDVRGVVTRRSAAEATEPARWVGEPLKDRVVTHDGRLLTGAVLLVGADRVQVDLDALGRVELGWDAIKTVDLAPVPPAAARGWVELRDGRTWRDVEFEVKGRRLHVRFQGGARTDVDLSDVLLFRAGAAPAEAPRVFVRLTTGTVLRATLGDLDGDVVRLRHPSLGPLAVPRHLVLDLRFER